MPHIGKSDGEIVIPPQVQNDATVFCPTCGDELSIVTSHERGGSYVADHFRHINNTECPGESDTHKKWKSIAYSKLNTMYPNSKVQIEKAVGDRRTDILVEFPSQKEHEGLGGGICVEIQYKNEGKDIEATNQELVSEGYSVLWLSEEQFHGKDVDLNAGKWIKWWLYQVPSIGDWTGYHSIVYWLKQVNYASVNLSIPIPFDNSIPISYYTKNSSEKLSIKEAWLRGVKKRVGNKVQIRYPCANCGGLVSGIVDGTHKSNPKEIHEESSYWMDLVFEGHNCQQCGLFNKVHRHAIRTVSTLDQKGGDNDDFKRFKPTTTLELPCMQCGSRLKFGAKTEPISSSDNTKMEVTIEDCTNCSECGSIIESYHTKVWISTHR